MDFIEKMKERAKKSIKTIVLPETEDIRILQATEIILKEKFAKIILIGDENKIREVAKNNNIDLYDAKIINNEEKNGDNELIEKYTNDLYELRKNKGMTKEMAKELLTTNSRYFATMMVKDNDADGFVSGAAHKTSDTLKPPLQIIKGKEGIKTVSAFFIMEVPNKQFGDNGVYIFADCGMNREPDEEQLADIAITSCQSFKDLIDDKEEPKVAMLSYSTHGSGSSPSSEKVRKATEIVKERNKDILIDGEIQLDAAIIEDVAKIKAPGSKVAGKANILIFPDLNSGNIGYKLTQRFGNAKAYGPLCQGMAKPVNDLSRGCSKEDIAGVVAITCVQASL